MLWVRKVRSHPQPHGVPAPVSGKLFPGSGMFWSQPIGGTSLTVIVVLVLVVVIAVACVGALTQ